MDVLEAVPHRPFRAQLFGFRLEPPLHEQEIDDLVIGFKGREHILMGVSEKPIGEFAIATFPDLPCELDLLADELDLPTEVDVDVSSTAIGAEECCRIDPV